MKFPIRWFLFNIRRLLVLCLISVLILLIVLCMFLTKQENNSKYPKGYSTPISSESNIIQPVKELISASLINNSVLKTEPKSSKVVKISLKQRSKELVSRHRTFEYPNKNVHVFYYAWYANPSTDGEYRHWNHVYLPNWRRMDNQNEATYPTGSHAPPEDIGASYYPKLGCYSSADPYVIKRHMKDMMEADIGVLVISWNPPGLKDSPDAMMPMLLDIALKYGIKVSLHVEPYKDRNPINLRNHLKDFFDKYKDHPALYKIHKKSSGAELPVLYIYDSYLTPASAWREMLSPKGNLSVRGTQLDAFYVGLLVEMQHRHHIRASHFDAFYTYFAADGFSYGSSWRNWRSLQRFALASGLQFIPSVGPGYSDTRVRAWNGVSTRPRRHGQYYSAAWRAALQIHAPVVSITSFNEWHEGTQIEPAIEKSGYLDYHPDGPGFYLNITRHWVSKLRKDFQT